MNEYTITLSKQSLSVINAALLELPYRVSAPIIADLNEQLRPQLANKDGEEG